MAFHFTPTSALWLNQVEIWLSILQKKSRPKASFTSVQQLREHMDHFIADYNANPKPFAWTKAEVHQRRMTRKRISDLWFREPARSNLCSPAIAGRGSRRVLRAPYRRVAASWLSPARTEALAFGLAGDR